MIVLDHWLYELFKLIKIINIFLKNYKKPFMMQILIGCLIMLNNINISIYFFHQYKYLSMGSDDHIMVHIFHRNCNVYSLKVNH